MQYQKFQELPDEAIKRDEKYLNGLSEKVIQFKEDTLRDNGELISGQVTKLARFHTEVETVLAKIQKNKKSCSEVIQSLENQVMDLDRKVEIYSRETDNDNVQEKLKKKIEDLTHEYVEVCKDRIKHAQAINIKKLSKVEIDDRKSLATQVFKWVLVAMYLEGQSKFYWPNFKKQALEKDHGIDFTERIGKVDARETKQEQKIKTQWFLAHYEDIKNCKQFKDCVSEIECLKNVAISFQRGYIIAGQMKESEIKISKHRQKTLEKDEESMRWRARSGALTDRVKINKQFLKVLHQAEQKLKPKLSLYQQKLESGKKLSEEFDSLNQWKPSIQIKTKDDHCECSIF